MKYLTNLIEQDHRPIKRATNFIKAYVLPQPQLWVWKRFEGYIRKEGTLFGFSGCIEIKVL